MRVIATQVNEETLNAMLEKLTNRSNLSNDYLIKDMMKRGSLEISVTIEGCYHLIFAPYADLAERVTCEDYGVAMTAMWLISTGMSLEGLLEEVKEDV